MWMPARPLSGCSRHPVQQRSPVTQDICFILLYVVRGILVGWNTLRGVLQSSSSSYPFINVTCQNAERAQHTAIYVNYTLKS